MKFFSTIFFKQMRHTFNQALLFLFPYLIILSYLFLLIEAYTYSGFIKKIILISATNFSGGTFLVGCFLLIQFSLLGKKVSKVLDYMFTLNRLFVPAAFFLWLLFFIQEKAHFPNYVFSHYHLNPDLFRSILIFNICILLLDFARFHRQKTIDFLKRNEQYQKQKVESYLFLIILFELTFVVLPTFIGISKVALFDVGHIVLHPFATYQQKQELAIPEYSYFAFIRDHTPQDAVIQLPPQHSPWLTTGNEGYARYFLYPRKIVKNADENYVDPRANYIIIDKGEWAVGNPNEYGWPRATVSAQMIWYFDPPTKRVTLSSESTFDPTNINQKWRWGLIQVRK